MQKSGYGDSQSPCFGCDSIDDSIGDSVGDSVGCGGESHSCVY